MHEQTNSRLTIRGILHEVWHTISHVERGLRNTLISLARHPGLMLRSYILGRRTGYHKPFSFLFICSTIHALILYLVHKYQDVQLSSNGALYEMAFIKNVHYLENKYYTWLHLMLLPYHVCQIPYKELRL